MAVANELIERFRRDLDAIARPKDRLGLAVSGGPDSLALLILAAEARPGSVEAATVDHKLRPESEDEAKIVGEVCERLQVPHRVLEVHWKQKPETGVQDRARSERYRMLGTWALDRALDALATAHHADDQAETFLMRLSRGAGVKGLAAMRAVSPTPRSEVRLLRPLLGWRRTELEQVCASAGLTAIQDPTNEDEQFERVRVRRALATADWLDPAAIARSASHLAAADGALHWATTQAWEQRVTAAPAEILFDPAGLPLEIRWRLVRRAILQLATEGEGVQLRGRELDQLLPILNSGRRATLRGVLCSGGKSWRFVPAPRRTRPPNSSRLNLG